MGIHLSVLSSVAGGHGPMPVASKADPVELVDVVPEEAPIVPPPRLDEPNTAGSSHRHAYLVEASHDARPHDPSLVHPSVAPAADAPADAPAVMTQDPQTPPRFTIALGTSAPSSRVVVNGAQGTGDTGGAEGIVSESAVSVPARLVSIAPASYPASARAEEVEADVAVEIVVDARGHVTEAKSIRKAGYGFDAAALEAVSRYRFSPALRSGHAVSVRMRWVVQFRLH